MGVLLPSFSLHGNLPWLVLITGVVLVSWRLLSIGMRPRGYPPGPPTLPIIGNLHQMPNKDIHLAYQRWEREIDGPIFSLKLGQQTLIVLASGEMIKRLVDKRSGNYADRQNIYMRTLYEDSRIIMRGYDDLWKVERRLYHGELNLRVASKYIPYQSLETKKLCADLLEDPKNFVNHIGRTTTSIATSMSYGFRIASAESPVMKEMFSNAHGFFGLVSRSKMLDWYPWLRPFVRLLPLSLRPLDREATKLYHQERSQFKQLYDDAVRNGGGNGSIPSFAVDMAKSQETWKGTPNGELLTHQAASYIAGIAFEGGADTTRNTLIGFLKAMALFPAAQATARDELDRIVGATELPTIEDLDRMPYMRCVVKEILRWFPTGINGAIPHAALHDDEIDGYHIPAGVGVVLAVWSANNDDQLFPNPREFDPARHMRNADLSAGEAALASDIKDRDHWSFGAGRRICPGMHLAERTLSLAIMRILWAFEIGKEKDARGEEVWIEPDEVTQSIAACPLPFRCRIAPRSAGRAAVVKKEWAEAKGALDGEGQYRGKEL